MPLKTSVVAWSHCRSVSRVCSRRSTATALANREGSPVTTGAAEDNQAWVTRPALAMVPRFLIGVGSAASVSFARH